MKTTKTKNRRNFLLAAGLGSAGAVAAVVAKSPVPLVKAEAAAQPQPSGYRSSEHIEKYYKTAEI